MHICLTIPEVQAIICDRLMDTNDKDALGKVARTCKALHIQPIAAMWRELRDIWPLLFCIPRDVFEKDSGTRFIVRRPVNLGDLKRFIFYARFVRRLCMPLYVARLLDATCWAALQMSLAPPILPNLQSLEWVFMHTNYTGPQVFQYLTLFLHPKITSLKIRVGYHSRPGAHPNATLLPNLPAKCPHMQDFALLDQKWATDDLIVMLWYLLCRWPGIRSLEVPRLDDSGMLVLAALPQLSSLRLFNPGRRDKFPDMPAPAFRALRSLSLTPSRLTFGINFFRSLPNTIFLREFRFKCARSQKEDHWRSLINELGRHCCPLTLEDIDINDDMVDDLSSEIGLHSLDSATLSPLLKFKNLVRVSLRCFGAFTLKDEDMKDLAKAWPLLEHLWLMSRRDENRPRCLTIRGLVPLAQHCRRLKNLVLDFDAEDLSFSDNPPAGARQRSLTYLDVEFSPLRSARIVAAYLSALFPCILDIECAATSSEGALVRNDSEESAARRKKWKRVADMLPVFGVVRAHERRGLDYVSDASEDIGEKELNDNAYDTDAEPEEGDLE